MQKNKQIFDKWRKEDYRQGLSRGKDRH